MAFPTSKVLAYRNAVIGAIRAKMPAAVSVEKHDGFFDLETIERYVSAAPAVYVSVMKATPSSTHCDISTGEQETNLSTVCYVLGTDVSSIDGSDLAWMVAEAISTMVVMNAFGSAFPAQDVNVESLWSNKIDKRRLALFSVHWTCETVIGTDFAALAEHLAGFETGDVFPPPEDVTLTVNESIGAVQSGAVPANAEIEGEIVQTSHEMAESFGIEGTLRAARDLSGHRIVKAVGSDFVDYASADNVNDSETVIGITTSATRSGDPVSILEAGVIIEPSWNFVPGAVYLGTEGALTQTVPTTGFYMQVGVATSPTRLIVKIRPAVILHGEA